MTEVVSISRLRACAEPSWTARGVLIGMLAMCVATGVLALGEFKGIKSLVQAGFAAGAVWCVWRYPVTASGVYLLGFYLPDQLLLNRAPLPYPHIVLPIALGAAVLVPAKPAVQIPYYGGAAWGLLVVLAIFTFASSLWGNEWVPHSLILGLAFAVTTFALLGTARDWWLTVGTLGAAELLVGVWTYFAARNMGGEAVVGHFARSETTGDVNYMSFHVGIALLAGWCIALCGGAMVTRIGWLCRTMRAVGLLVAIVGLVLLVQFESRGMSVAVVGALAASLIHPSVKWRTRIASMALLGLLVLAVAHTPAYKSFMERWEDSETVKSGTGRSELWDAAWQQYNHSRVITHLVGFGYGTEIWHTKFSGLVPASQVSTHNSFLRFLLDQGLLGAGLFCGVLAICAYHAWRRNDGIGHLRFVLLVFLVIACLSLDPHVVTEFWLAFALCLPLGLGAKRGPFKNALVSCPSPRRHSAERCTSLCAPKSGYGARKAHPRTWQPGLQRVPSVGFAVHNAHRRFPDFRLPE